MCFCLPECTYRFLKVLIAEEEKRTNSFNVIIIIKMPLSLRYFQCKNKHGLFAPVHKVSKVRGKAASRHPSQSDGLSQGKLSNSSSSINSMGSSNTSSLSRGMTLGSGDLGSSPRGSMDSKKSQVGYIHEHRCTLSVPRIKGILNVSIAHIDRILIPVHMQDIEMGPWMPMWIHGF